MEFCIVLFCEGRVQARGRAAGRPGCERPVKLRLFLRHLLLLSYSRSSSSPTPAPSSTCSWRSGFPCMLGSLALGSLSFLSQSEFLPWIALRPRSHRTASGSACRLPGDQRKREDERGARPTLSRKTHAEKVRRALARLTRFVRLPIPSMKQIAGLRSRADEPNGLKRSG